MFAGAFSSALGDFLATLLVLAGVIVYVTLVRQISVRRATADNVSPPAKAFGLAELFIAIALIVFFLWMIAGTVSRPPPKVSVPLIIANELLFVVIVLLVMTYLRGIGRLPTSTQSCQSTS